MTIVPLDGVVRKLYEDATKNIEYQSSAFWQVWLQRAFCEEHFIVVCEFPPDSSLRRVDIVVREYNQDQHTITSVVYTESKKPKGSRKDVKDQATDAARLAIEHDSLHGVYAMTTIGTTFQVWYMTAEDKVLEPLGIDKYIDADSEQALTIWETINLIKGSPPLRIAPVLPSHAPLIAQSGEGSFQATQDPWTTQQGGEEDNEDDGRTTDTEAKDYIHVRVTKRAHTFGPDEFHFTDSRGKTRITKKADWTMQTSNGSTIWVYQGGKRTYYTDHKIG
ncbi:hypothetical protein F4823DRAFT_638688 [Ustulina deusta]|nr:hypothetical protein F4823DRAFT_638688 [Ustulina deusta]